MPNGVHKRLRLLKKIVSTTVSGDVGSADAMAGKFGSKDAREDFAVTAVGVAAASEHVRMRIVTAAQDCEQMVVVGREEMLAVLVAILTRAGEPLNALGQVIEQPSDQ
jgi:hypothetical protein